MLISPLLATLQKKLKTSSPAPLFSTSQTASNAVIPTASAHNYSSMPHHNSVPPHSRVISLHAHSVAAAMHSFLYNISHTPRERSPHALPCNSNGETAAEKKETTNKTDLNPKIRKCSHWCGDLISCYNAFILPSLVDIPTIYISCTLMHLFNVQHTCNRWISNFCKLQQIMHQIHFNHTSTPFWYFQI